MNVAVLHNPKAGRGQHSREAILTDLTRLGYNCRYASVKDDGWEDLLADQELIVIAGGDGTVDKVAAKMRGQETPLAVLPLGTANNMARRLGMMGDPAAVMRRWRTATPTGIDLGVARGPWDRVIFVEAAGIGFFPQMMPFIGALRSSRSFPDGEAVMRFERETLRDLLKACQARRWSVKLDGVDASGEYLLVAAMNIDALGPRLQIAPTADPGDGRLDVVLLTEDDRDALYDYLGGALDAPPAKGFVTRPATRVEIAWDGSNVHLDSHIWAQGHQLLEDIDSRVHHAPTNIELRVDPQAVRFLVAPT